MPAYLFLGRYGSYNVAYILLYSTHEHNYD